VKRAFLAVEIPSFVKEELGSLKKILKGMFSSGRPKWVDPGIYHLTLKFIGDFEEAQVGRAAAALVEVVRFQKPFTLYFKGVGVFPNSKNPRVLWCDVEGEVEKLYRLQQSAERALITVLGLSQRRQRFHPHVTMARFREPQAVGVSAEQLASIKLQTSPFWVRRLGLFESRLSARGPEYILLEEILF
jgi:2'-5' RNA ligase